MIVLGLIIKRDENGKYYATDYGNDEKERTKNNSNLIKTVPLNTKSAAFLYIENPAIVAGFKRA